MGTCTGRTDSCVGATRSVQYLVQHWGSTSTTEPGPLFALCTTSRAYVISGQLIRKYATGSLLYLEYFLNTIDLCIP